MMCDDPRPKAVTVSNISLSIGLDDTAKAKLIFDNLSDGGKVKMPLDKTFWADAFGMLTDKFGIKWMINCNKPADEGERAARADRRFCNYSDQIRGNIIMTEPILVAKNDANEFFLLTQMANRHGVITGATGTGKTVTLQRIAEGFSQRGVPVFMADIKGDLTGVTQPGGGNPKIDDRNKQLGITTGIRGQFPATLWDVFGKQGHPLRATVSEMGPLLIARLLQLNDTQEGVLDDRF